MLTSIRAALRRRGRRAIVVCCIVLMGAAVIAAHSSVREDHMGQAAAMCLAVLVVGSGVVAALPLPGRPLPRALWSVGDASPCLRDAATDQAPIRARGDPPVLQMFRL